MGPELITNGGFDGNADGWTLGATASYGAGIVSIAHAAGITVICLTQNTLSLVSGKAYKLEFDLLRSAGSVAFDIEQGISSQQINVPPVAATGHYAVNFVAGLDATDLVLLSDSGGFTGSIDNISLREVISADLPTYNTSLISAVARVKQGLNAPEFIMGGRESGSYKLFKKSNSYAFNVFRSRVCKPSSPFVVKEILIPLTGAVDTNQQIVPVLYFDSGSATSVGTPINPTNYANGETFIKLTADSFPDGCMGQEDVFLELQFTGSALAPVSLPITIFVDTLALP